MRSAPSVVSIYDADFDAHCDPDRGSGDPFAAPPSGQKSRGAESRRLVTSRRRRVTEIRMLPETRRRYDTARRSGVPNRPGAEPC